MPARTLPARAWTVRHRWALGAGDVLEELGLGLGLGVDVAEGLGVGVADGLEAGVVAGLEDVLALGDALAMLLDTAVR
jgi:hypothetical protein